jgi:hypothetical protein
MRKYIVKTDSGQEFPFYYDPRAPCSVCGNPVINLSMNGSTICPGCDCGIDRSGRRPELFGQDIFRLRGYEHLRPWVPTFQEVEAAYTMVSVRGVHVKEWEIANKILDDIEELSMKSPPVIQGSVWKEGVKQR